MDISKYPLMDNTPAPATPIQATFHNQPIIDAIWRVVKLRVPAQLIVFEQKDVKGLNETFGFRKTDELLLTVNQLIEGEVSKIHPCVSIKGTKGRHFVLLEKQRKALLLENNQIRSIYENLEGVLNYHFSGLLSLRAAAITIGSNNTRPDNILLAAEELLKSSSLTGQNVIFENNALLTQTSNTRHSLKRAIAHNEFTLHYQPIICVKTGGIKALEALARWQQPDGEKGPGFFIGDLSKHELMEEFGWYVCEKALAQRALWVKQGKAKTVTISINVSLHQLRSDTFSKKLESLIKTNNLDPGLLQLEITEDHVGDDRALNQLTYLSGEVGVKVAIDDFGTGRSNIARLRKLNINVIKIDKSILYDCTNDNDEIFLARLVQMCRSIVDNVIIEGVETKQQRDFAIRAGVDAIQGFYYQKPQPPESMDIS